MPLNQGGVPSSVSVQEAMPCNMYYTRSSSRSSSSVSTRPVRWRQASARQVAEDANCFHDPVDLSWGSSFLDKTPGGSSRSSGKAISTERLAELEMLKRELRDSRKFSLSDFQFRTMSRQNLSNLSSQRSLLYPPLTRTRSNMRHHSQMNNNSMAFESSCGEDWFADQVMSEVYLARSVSDTVIALSREGYEKSLVGSNKNEKSVPFSVLQLNLHPKNLEIKSEVFETELAMTFSTTPKIINRPSTNVDINEVKCNKDSNFSERAEKYAESNKEEHLYEHQSKISSLTGAASDICEEDCVNSTVGENIVASLSTEFRGVESVGEFENGVDKGHSKVGIDLYRNTNSSVGKSRDKTTESYSSTATGKVSVGGQYFVCGKNSNNCNYINVCLKNVNNEKPSNNNDDASFLKRGSSKNTAIHYQTSHSGTGTTLSNEPIDAVLSKKISSANIRPQVIKNKLGFRKDRGSLQKMPFLAKLKKPVQSASSLLKRFSFKNASLHSNKLPVDTHNAEQHGHSLDSDNRGAPKETNTASESSFTSDRESKQAVSDRRKDASTGHLQHYRYSEPNPFAWIYENRQSFSGNPGEIVLPATFLDLFVRKTAPKTSDLPSYQTLEAEEKYRHFCKELKTENRQHEQSCLSKCDPNKAMSYDFHNDACGQDPKRFIYHDQETTFPVSPWSSPLTSHTFYTHVWRRSAHASQEFLNNLSLNTSTSNEEHHQSARIRSRVREILCKWRQIALKNEARDKEVPIEVARILPRIHRRAPYRALRASLRNAARWRNEMRTPAFGTLKVSNAETETKNYHAITSTTSKSLQVQKIIGNGTPMLIDAKERSTQQNTHKFSRKDIACVENGLAPTEICCDNVDRIENNIEPNLQATLDLEDDCSVLERTETPLRVKTMDTGTNNVTVFPVSCSSESHCIGTSGNPDAPVRIKPIHTCTNNVTVIPVSYPSDGHCIETSGSPDVQASPERVTPRELQRNDFVKDIDLNSTVPTNDLLSSSAKSVKAENQTQSLSFSQSSRYPLSSKPFNHDLDLTPLVSSGPRKSRSSQSQQHSQNIVHKTPPFVSYGTKDVVFGSSYSLRRQPSLINRSYSEPSFAPHSLQKDQQANQSRNKDLRRTFIESEKCLSSDDKLLEKTEIAPSSSDAHISVENETIINAYQDFCLEDDETMGLINVEDTLEEMRARCARALKAKEKLMADADTIGLWDTWQCPPHTQRFCGDGYGISDLGSMTFGLPSQTCRSLREFHKASQGQVIGTLTIEYTKPPVEGLVVLQ
ncbi:hypothetical protein ElyMa_005049100 [Elysia marginata]|uniref:Uncharacterized protein n=1 Tax=Elysia marginata TaxID=1093978 RepID=A0AAV4JFH3_9GAST|nr:hypothetical protein ElyMa_005049100 [Elysia marginata]